MLPTNSQEPQKAIPSTVQIGPVVPISGPPMGIPDISRTKPLTDKIKDAFPSAKVDYITPKRLKVTVPPAEIKSVAIFVRDTLGFDHLNVVGGTDYTQQGEFEVMYFVGSPFEAGPAGPRPPARGAGEEGRAPQGAVSHRRLGRRGIPREGDLRDARHHLRRTS